MSASKKDYMAMAKALSEYYRVQVQGKRNVNREATFRRMVDIISNVFKDGNARFDHQLFEKAIYGDEDANNISN